MQDPVSLEALKTLAVEVNRRLGKSGEATFRLGQMDMKESIADMLEGVSKGTSGFLLSDALIHAAALVRSMKVPEGCIEE